MEEAFPIPRNDNDNNTRIQNSRSGSAVSPI
jgi:hypothetical protein